MNQGRHFLLFKTSVPTTLQVTKLTMKPFGTQKRIQE